ncbi:MAG TPA: hypothetical protein VLA82_04785 [Actinomycetota bacterium]|nr:hypothetical protein [Actinomycetota bacterium]
MKRRPVQGRSGRPTPSSPATADPGTASTVGPDGTDESVEALRAEPEPGWADAIRRGRRDRAERLRSVFASFDDETGPGPAADEVTEERSEA